MKLLVYLGHPAHFHLFRFVIRRMRENGHEVSILARKKDVLEDLLREEGWEFQNVSPRLRSENIFGMVGAMIGRQRAIFREATRNRPDLMIGTSAEIGHVGRLLGIRSIVVNEDDADVVPLFANLAYPFCNHILAPGCCRMGRWAYKTVFYESYHELAYLHPNFFKPDREVVKEFHRSDQPYFIVRFAQLSAHHDKGRKGIAGKTARDLIELLASKGAVYITSERKLEPEFEKYRISLCASKIHHALAFATLYVGDSQTMAAEAAVLGTPSLRFNDFVQEISYLNELENRYGLTYGIATGEPKRLFRLVEKYANREIKKEWARRREAMLDEKVDLATYLVRFLQNYPQSVTAFDETPEEKSPTGGELKQLPVIE